MNIAEYLKTIDAVVANGKYQDNWESLAAYPVPAWYRQAKFGVFIHWGAYSVPAYLSEWYPRMMHYRGNPTYWHHKRKYGKTYPYRKFIEAFKGEKFDADAWVKLFKKAGMRYVMPVAEHHDGYKLYDSALSRWTTTQQAMGRDVLGEIKNACEQEGLVFACSSHRAEHFWFLNGAKTLPYHTETLDAAYQDLYGECHNVQKGNNLVAMLKQEKGIVPSKEWLEDWLVHSAELIDKYRPETLFFDWWIMNHAFRPYFKKFMAYYYNRSLEWGKEVCVQYKSDAAMYNTAIYDVERGQLEGISPYIWQSETSTARNAWCYTTGNIWKTPQEIACVFADVIAKNGNFVLNVGPKADGTFCEKETAILEALGVWTKRNEAAIWGTAPYKVFGEGKGKKGGSFKDRFRPSKKDFRYTYRTSHIYAFALKPNKKGVYRMRMLNGGRDSFSFAIQSVRVLGYDCSVRYKVKKKYLELVLEGTLPETRMPLCFDIHVD